MSRLDKLGVVARYQALLALRYRNGAPFKIVATVVEIASAYFLTRAIGPHFRPDGINYFAFLLTGTSVYMFLLAVVSSCVSFVEDSQTSGTLEVLMTTPTPPLEVLLLNVVPVLGSKVLGMFAYLAIGMWFFATEPLHINVLAASAVFLLLIVVALAAGMLGAAIQILFFRGNSLVWALGVLGGLFMGTLFPVSVLPAPLQWIAGALPLQSSLDAFRSAMLRGSSVGELSSSLTRLAVYGVVALFVGTTCFQFALRRARRLGALGFY